MKNRKTEQTERTDDLEAMRVKERAMRAMASPYRFFVIAAVLAALFSMLPTRADAPEEGGLLASGDEMAQERRAEQAEDAAGLPAGADLSERTQQGAYLHRTFRYVCGHSVQRREALDARLTGLSHAALEAEIGNVIAGAQVTGFSAREVDIAQAMEIPCPLHWVLRLGESGRLEVLQNMNGEALSLVREMEIGREQLSGAVLQELLEGVTFDNAQALEGYLESLSS